MQNKILSVIFMGVFVISGAYAEDVIDAQMDELSAQAVNEYQVEGSLFQQITDLEQEKIFDRIYNLLNDDDLQNVVLKHLLLITFRCRHKSEQTTGCDIISVTNSFVKIGEE